MLRVLLITAVVLSGGCASKFETVDCKGPVVALNATHWTPTASDVAAMAALCGEDK